MLEQAMIHFLALIWTDLFPRSFKKKGLGPLWFKREAKFHRKCEFGGSTSRFLKGQNNIHRRFRETNSDFTRNQMRSTGGARKRTKTRCA